MATDETMVYFCILIFLQRINMEKISTQTLHTLSLLNGISTVTVCVKHVAAPTQNKKPKFSAQGSNNCSWHS